MKRFALVTGLLLVLTACGGGAPEAACDQEYWDGVYGTCLPAGWSVVDRETLTLRGVPAETIAAFRADDSVSGQFPSVIVTQEPLKQETDPADYSDASIRSVSVLPGYSLVNSKEVSIDDAKVTLHTFSAQPVEGEAARRFYQMSTTVGNMGYTVNGTVPLFIEKDLEAQILLILEQSTFISPQ